jgi:hypothetical protein
MIAGSWRRGVRHGVVRRGAVIVLAAGLAACGSGGTPSSPAPSRSPAAGPGSSAPGSGAPGTAAAGCADVRPAVLPVWARAGFSDPEPRMPYVLGHRGQIAAVLFGLPFQAPPPADHNNKILWVPRVTQDLGDTLRIEARLDGAGPPVVREVPGGPGPSVIDLPRPGCWHLTLHWSGLTDTLELRYLPRP